MATKKTTKKMTKKTTTKKATVTRSSSSSPAAPAKTTPIKTTPDKLTYPRPVPAPAAPEEPPVEIRPYKHVGDQAVAFMAKYPDGVYFHLDKVSKKENEAAIKSLSQKTPIFVDGKTFSAGELQELGFKVFQNGQGGKLIGTRGV